MTKAKSKGKIKPAGRDRDVFVPKKATKKHDDWRCAFVVVAGEAKKIPHNVTDTRGV